MQQYKFAGYRIAAFPRDSKDALEYIASILVPHQQEILQSWIDRQWAAWQPPGLNQSELKVVFGSILETILHGMSSRELETSMSELEGIGKNLAASGFPFEALIMSIHFLEQSYLPMLLGVHNGHASTKLIAMDEFLHATLAAVATSYFATYRKELLDQAEVGRLVQEGLMADIPKHSADLEIAHIYTSASERAQLGGDFLDFFSMGSEGVAFILGDLAGHGLEAAADSVMIRSMYRGFMNENPDPTDAMGRMNRVFCSELKSGLFATALAVTYDMRGMLTLVSAGHPYPMLCGGSTCEAIHTSGMALAIDEDSTYERMHIQLERGGIFLAYTDGLIESRHGNDFFGEERVLLEMEKMRDAGARDIAEHIMDTSLRFCGGKFADDVAILVLKRRG